MLFYRRTYRPTASPTERAWTAACVVGLGALLLWFRARGDAVNPDLFRLDPALLESKPQAPPVFAPELVVRVSHVEGADEVAAAFPERVPGYGFRRTGPVEVFGPENLYEKINGREALYKSFGFEKLYWASYEQGDESVDVEVFRQENAMAAFGVFSAERQGMTGPGLEAQRTVTPNGLYFVQGQNYVRLLGSAASPTIRRAVDALEPVLVRILDPDAAPAAPPRREDAPTGAPPEGAGHVHACPVGYDEPCSHSSHFPEAASSPAPPEAAAAALLADPASWTPLANPLVKMGADPSSLEFHQEFGMGLEAFAGLYVGTLSTSAGDARAFLLPAADEAAAEAAYEAYTGMLAKTAAPVELVWPAGAPTPRASAKMEMLDTYEAAFLHGRWVTGVTETEDQEAAEAALARLVDLMEAAP
jgi:hypothetical protein